MNKYSHLVYKRGFFLTDIEGIEVHNEELQTQISNWKNLKFKKYNIYIENSVEHTLLSRRGITILIIGLVLNPFKNQYKQTKIAKSLIKSRVLGEVNFLDELDELSGRFTIIINFEDITKIYNDACGTRTIYYDTSDNHTLISSHSHLIADICGYSYSETIRSYVNDKSSGGKYLPGLLSPFDEVKLLTPNTTYSLEDKKISRYFPRSNNEKISTDEAIAKLLPILKKQSQLLDSISPTIISVTSGLDSRVTLAVHSDQNTNSKYFTHYNYDNIEPFQEDMKISEKISRELDLDYTIFGYSTKENSDDLNEYRSIWQRNVGMYRGSLKMFKMYTDNISTNRIHVRSNCAEIARNYYKNKRQLELNSLNLSLLHGNPNKKEFTIDQFDEFIDTTKFYKEYLFNYHYSDLFYWEHRMGMWHSWIVLESDTAFETFVPFNNREILKIMLAIPEEERDTDDLMIGLIKELNPNLLKYPINKVMV